jgi:hypothetical protein
MFVTIAKAANVEHSERIKRLWEHFWKDSDLYRAGRGLSDIISILDRPPTLTNRELSQVIERLTSSNLGANEIEASLGVLNVELSTGFIYFVQALGLKLRQDLGSAIDSFSAEQSREYTERAHKTLSTLDRLVSVNLSFISQPNYEVFNSVYETVLSYRAGRSVEKVKLSQIEDKVLLATINAASDEEVRLIDSAMETNDADDPELAERTKLIHRLRVALGVRVASVIQRQFTYPDFATFIQSRTYHSMFQRVIADPDGSLWAGPGTEGWLATLDNAKDNPIVWKNAFDCLTELTGFLRVGIALDGKSISLAKSEKALSALSKAALSSPFTRTFQYKYMKARAALMSNGAVEGALPIPNWFSVNEILSMASDGKDTDGEFDAAGQK